jgi:hypothetical protein
MSRATHLKRAELYAMPLMCIGNATHCSIAHYCLLSISITFLRLGGSAFARSNTHDAVDSRRPVYA